MTCRCMQDAHKWPVTPAVIDQYPDTAIEVWVCLECGSEKMRVFPSTQADRDKARWNNTGDDNGLA